MIGTEVSDSGGLSPQRLLAQHLQLLQLHVPQLRQSDRRMPSWCAFGALQPGKEKVPLADVAVEVEGVALYAHRVILAAASPKWHQQLRRRGSGASWGFRGKMRPWASCRRLGRAMYMLCVCIYTCISYQ